MILGCKQQIRSRSWRNLTCDLVLWKEQDVTPTSSFQKPQIHFLGTEKHTESQLLRNHNPETHFQRNLQVLGYLERLTKMPKYSLARLKIGVVSCLLGHFCKPHQSSWLSVSAIQPCPSKSAFLTMWSAWHLCLTTTIPTTQLPLASEFQIKHTDSTKAHSATTIWQNFAQKPFLIHYHLRHIY